MSGDGWTEINVALPLPLDVASVLMQLVGKAYPSALIDMSGKAGIYGLSFLIDPKERVLNVSEDEARDIVAASQPELMTFGNPSDLSISSPQELSLFLGEIAHSIFTNTDGAINYVEWSIRTDDGDQYVLTIAKSKSQLPSALLKVANNRISELESAVCHE